MDSIFSPVAAAQKAREDFIARRPQQSRDKNMTHDRDRKGRDQASERTTNSLPCGH